MPESEKELQARWILRKEPPACVCNPVNPRHREPWKCITKGQLEAWKAAEKPPVLRDETAKRLACLWLHFSQHPQARKLSGREDLTAEGFELRYAERCGLSIKELRDLGRVVRPCRCGEVGCEGWQSISRENAKDLGLDTWDDAAGMSELEKGMFE